MSEEEELSQTIQVWVPYQCKGVRFGKPHPGAVVEAHSLAAVDLPANDYPIQETLQMQIDDGTLSNMQLEGIAYAGQRHSRRLSNDQRAGFFVADATGIGKGRQLAGIILDNVLRGRLRAIWLSSSKDLFVDATRDFREINCSITLIDGIANIHKFTRKRPIPDACVLFMTYGELVGHKRIEDVTEFLCRGITPGAFEGVIVLDECHRAKHYQENKTSTRTGDAVVLLQNTFPLARVVYSSATGIDSLKNMGYMTRMGLWGPGTAFSSFKKFTKVGNGSTTILETLATQFKSTGCHVARHVGYQGTEFHQVVIPINEEFQIKYALFSRLWHDVAVDMRRCFELCDLTDGNREAIIGAPRHKQTLSYFWACHQHFSRQLMSCIKVHEMVNRVKARIAEGKSVVIGIQDTGEASVHRSMKYEKFIINGDGVQIGKRMISVCRDIMRNFVQEHFPFKRTWIPLATDPESIFHADDLCEYGIVFEQIAEKYGMGSASFRQSMSDFVLPSREYVEMEISTTPAYRSNGDVSECLRIRRKLLERIERTDFPPCALDDLIDRLGGSSCVAELTGRSVRQARVGDAVHVIKRKKEIGKKRANWDAGDASINGQERESFMNGTKFIAIMSDAASTGISIHADAGVSNQRRRVHMTMELAWSADKAIQQLGRTNRTNQTSAPIYETVTTDLGGERRFSYAVARRLRTLGAITHGDRRVSDDHLTSLGVAEEDALRAIAMLVKAAVVGDFPTHVDFEGALARARPSLRTSSNPDSAKNVLLQNVAHACRCRSVEGECTSRCHRYSVLARHARHCATVDCQECSPEIRARAVHCGACQLPGFGPSKCKICFGNEIWCPLPNEWTKASVMDTLVDAIGAMVSDKSFYKSPIVDKDVSNTLIEPMKVAQFFNRLMMLPPTHQALVYECFVSCGATVHALDAFYVLPFTHWSEDIVRTQAPERLFRDSGTGAELTFNRLRRNRGQTFDVFARELMYRVAMMSDPKASRPVERAITDEEYADLCESMRGYGGKFHRNGDVVCFGIQRNQDIKSVRPSTCRDTVKSMNYAKFIREWKGSVDELSDVRRFWDAEYVESESKCIHGGRCTCSIGKRVCTFGVVTGCVMMVWDRLQANLQRLRAREPDWQMFPQTFVLANGDRLVGVSWPIDFVDVISDVLKEWRSDTKRMNRMVTIDGFRPTNLVPPPHTTVIDFATQTIRVMEAQTFDVWTKQNDDEAQRRTLGFVVDSRTRMVIETTPETEALGLSVGFELATMESILIREGTFKCMFKAFLAARYKSFTRAENPATVVFEFIRPVTASEKKEELRFQRDGLKQDPPARRVNVPDLIEVMPLVLKKTKRDESFVF